MQYKFLFLPIMVDWLSSNFWLCFDDIIVNYFPNSTLDVYTTNNLSEPYLNFTGTTWYLSTGPYKPKRSNSTSVIIGSEILLNLKNVREPAIVITRSLQHVETLWKNSKVADLLVLQVDGEKINAFTWFPYNTKHSEPSLELIDVWHNKRWTNKTNLRPKKFGSNFQEWPLRMTQADCFGYNSNLSGKWMGPEYDIVQTFLKYFNFSAQYLKSDYVSYWLPSSETYAPEPFHYLSNQETDLAYPCFDDNMYNRVWADALPVHTFESVTWFVPTPKPKSDFSKLYRGFAPSLWFLIFVFYILVNTVLKLAANAFNSKLYQSISYSSLTVLALFLDYGVFLKRNGLQKFLPLVYFLSLHLHTLYTATIILSLSKAAYDEPVQTIEEALQANYTAIIRVDLKKLVLTNPDENFKRILDSNNFLITESYAPRSTLETIYNKTHIFLGFRYLDEAWMTFWLPDKPFKTNVNILKHSVTFSPFAMYMSPGNPLLPLLTEKTNQLIEAGFVKRWLEEALDIVVKGPEEDEHHPLDLESVKAAFSLLFIGLMTSFLSFLTEAIPPWYGNAQNKNSLRHKATA